MNKIECDANLLVLMHVFVEFMLKQCMIMLLELGGCDFKARFKGDFFGGGFLKFLKIYHMNIADYSEKPN